MGPGTTSVFSVVAAALGVLYQQRGDHQAVLRSLAQAAQQASQERQAVADRISGAVRSTATACEAGPACPVAAPSSASCPACPACPAVTCPSPPVCPALSAPDGLEQYFVPVLASLCGVLGTLAGVRRRQDGLDGPPVAAAAAAIEDDGPFDRFATGVRSPTSPTTPHKKVRRSGAASLSSLLVSGDSL